MIHNRIKIAGLVILLASLTLFSQATAIVLRRPPELINAPLGRLLSNVDAQRKANPAHAAKYDAIKGRLYLLAYVQRSPNIPFYENRTDPLPQDLHRFPDPDLAEDLKDSKSIGRNNASMKRILDEAIAANIIAAASNPTNMRVKLGLAYLFDRAGRKEEALIQLYETATIGFHSTTGKTASSDIIRSLRETRDHLKLLGVSTKQGKRVISRLNERLRNVEEVRYTVVTPVLVPQASGLAFESLIDASADTAFDLNGIALWRDLNSDGVGTENEIVSAKEAGITTLRFDYQRRSESVLESPRGVEFLSGEVRPTYDWTPPEHRQ